jgi:hypothetical protein
MTLLSRFHPSPVKASPANEFQAGFHLHLDSEAGIFNATTTQTT